MDRPLLTFDVDGVLCRPPFGINPGKHEHKVRRAEGTKGAFWWTEPYRYIGRKPMPGSVEGLRALAERFDCQILTARTERTRAHTEAWLRRYFGVVPPLHLRPNWDESPSGFKARRTRELGAFAHFEDDPHTAAWVAEGVSRVFIVDWPRNRWLAGGNIHRIRALKDALGVLDAG
ncbi:MAG: hypothetical protein ACKVVT_06335 [Dehalococcoidia bacterium]